MRPYTYASAGCTFLLLIAATLAASCGSSSFRVEEFAPVIRAYPTLADEWFNLGIACTILEREDEAVKAYEEALRLNSNDAEARFNLGVMLSILDREDEAEAAFREALKAKLPVTQHFKLGLAYYTLKRYGEAANELEQAIRANEPHPVTNYIKLGLSYNGLGRYDDAARTFGEAIRLNPEIALNYYNAAFYLGVSLQLGRKLREAAEAYREAIRIRPDFAYARFNLGVVCLSIGDIASAREQVEALRGLDLDASKTLDGYLRLQRGKPR